MQALGNELSSVEDEPDPENSGKVLKLVSVISEYERVVVPG